MAGNVDSYSEPVTGQRIRCRLLSEQLWVQFLADDGDDV
jgi:hypothetical protein